MSENQLPERLAASKLHRPAALAGTLSISRRLCRFLEGRAGAGGCATVGVTVRDGGIALLYAPRFVAGCTLPELTGVLLHEVNHLLFGHVFADPKQFPDRDGASNCRGGDGQRVGARAAAWASHHARPVPRAAGPGGHGHGATPGWPVLRLKRYVLGSRR